MTPLDQENRDWSKGNCFYVTLEFINDSEALRTMGGINADSTVCLVHGLLDSSNKRVKHAWIEIDDRVLDHSNNQAINASAEDYYRDNSALVVRRFTRAETDALLTALKTQDSPMPIGYWGDLSDYQVSAALIGYQESNGVFSSGVCFSDPADAANSDNLKINGEQGVAPNA
jgi:hypothetical protein